MNQNWEEKFKRWAAPPGKTEKERCSNAEKAIRNAIKASDKLNHRNIRIFTQGSYRNNTNVRADSDVDVGILCFDTFFYDFPEGYTRESFGIIPASYHYEQFKNEVGEALISYFGSGAVSRGNKAFDVHETSYHVEADVAAFFEHRRYSTDGKYLSGVELRPDNGGKIINWPEQHYQNGVEKNKATSRAYKSLVRIIKSLCNEMSEQNIQQAKEICGFLIECLVWNVPNSSFSHSDWTGDVRACLAYLFNNTKEAEKCIDWGEVSELKYLFRGGQKWTRQQAFLFIDKARDHIGFPD
ncbi:MAG: nucleotidyltransferase [Desulfobacteraceae bacterium]|nr:nucleotidyltransferase [Desulfobacteraceae bacterium]